MKIAIIIPNLIESVPYVKNFTEIFDSKSIDYEFICWNRNQVLDIKNNSEKLIVFQHPGYESNRLVKKLRDYWLFSRFVIKHLKKNDYDYLTVHTIVCGVFLSSFIGRKYKNRYVFDIRDYSPVYKFSKGVVRKLVSNACCTLISSESYENWLPKGYKYILSHNVRKEEIQSLSGNFVDFKTKENITILTIGQIRDFSSNSKVIDAFGNKKNINLVFSGSGLQKNNLEEYCTDKYSNISFTGRYKKEQESNLVRNADFINVILPTDPNVMTQMTNRFYLSLIHKKPMLVNSESIQAKFVEKYKLGVAVSSTDDIHEVMLDYLKEFDKVKFEKGCNDVLKLIRRDIDNFENEIMDKFI